MYRWKFLSQSTLFGWGGCRVAMEIARADDFWYTPPMGKSKIIHNHSGGGGGGCDCEPMHTLAVLISLRRIYLHVCAVYISHHVLCLWGGGGSLLSFCWGCRAYIWYYFWTFSVLAMGGGGGEGDYWTSRYRLFNKFCHGFLSGLGYYLSYFSNRLQWCGNYISVYVITYHKNYVNIYVRMHKFCVVTVNPSFKGHCDEGTPCHQGTLSQNHDLSSTC